MKPFLLGAAMAVAMLWMGHERIMAGGADLTAGAVLFALAHLGVLAVLLAAALFVPALRRRVLNHRPDARHMAAMVAGMALTAGTIHLVLHGGFA